jgi:hypothetical protein
MNKPEYGPQPEMKELTVEVNETTVEATERENLIAEYAGSRALSYNQKEQKYVALYKARVILSKIGTMKERSICKSQLVRMQKLGLSSL